MHSLPILLYATIYRLEFQYGFSVPVSQLEGVCGRLCPALCVCCGGTHLHARKSQVLPWGNFPELLQLKKYPPWNISDISWICCNSCICSVLCHCHQLSALINFTFHISAIIRQANRECVDISQPLFNQTKQCESSKTLGGGLMCVCKIEAWRSVTVGLLLRDNYPLK